MPIGEKVILCLFAQNVDDKASITRWIFHWDRGNLLIEERGAISVYRRTSAALNSVVTGGADSFRSRWRKATWPADNKPGSLTHKLLRLELDPGVGILIVEIRVSNGLASTNSCLDSVKLISEPLFVAGEFASERVGMATCGSDDPQRTRGSGTNCGELGDLAVPSNFVTST